LPHSGGTYLGRRRRVNFIGSARRKAVLPARKNMNSVIPGGQPGVTQPAFSVT
jgi:hypothetical protein